MTPLSLPTELWIKIALHSPRDIDEHVFNSLVRAIPALGRWTIAGHNGEIVSRRLNLMLAFGYSVRFTSQEMSMYCPMATTINRSHGSIVWKKNGRIHRNDGPAAVSNGGDLHTHNARHAARYSWLYHGRFHRVDGPSCESFKSYQAWHQHGGSHRRDGPADIYDHGEVGWYQDNNLHRLDGPASIDNDGVIMWYVHDEQHRTDGPAVICPNGKCMFYQNGVEIPR